MNYIVKKYYLNNNNTWLQITKLFKGPQDNKILN